MFTKDASLGSGRWSCCAWKWTAPRFIAMMAMPFSPFSFLSSPSVLETGLRTSLGCVPSLCSSIPLAKDGRDFSLVHETWKRWRPMLLIGVREAPLTTFTLFTVNFHCSFAHLFLQLEVVRRAYRPCPPHSELVHSTCGRLPQRGSLRVELE